MIASFQVLLCLESASDCTAVFGGPEKNTKTGKRLPPISAGKIAGIALLSPSPIVEVEGLLQSPTEPYD